MSEQIKEINYDNNVNVHIIPTKKFKTISIVVKCKSPLNRETITRRAFLTLLLTQGTENYPSEKQLMMKLDELYGATLSIDGVKKGNNHIISFRLEIANEKYIKNETTMLNEAFELLHDVIFNPNIKENSFPEKVVNREKSILKNRIESIVDDKIAYANMRMIDEMCDEEVFKTHTNGYIEDLETINGKEMYSYYNQLLKEDRFDVYVVGDFAEQDMKDRLHSVFNLKDFNLHGTKGEKESYKQKRIEEQEIIETQPIQQAKLHIGYRTNCTYEDEDYFALQIFNGLFGGFPSSKLFINVREKNSLAYYASSRIESHKGLLIVLSGIDGNDYNKAKEIIDLQLVAMKDGQFTEDEIERTKELVISQIEETLDSSVGIIELLYQQVIADKRMSPQEFIDSIKRVTKEDIIRVANKIEPDTVYLLKNSGGEDIE